MGNIVIVEDQAFLRNSLCDMCARTGRHRVVGQADDGPLAIELMVKKSPDAVILDLSLRTMSGFDVIDRAKAAGVSTAFVILSGYCDNYTTYRVEAAGVRGFVSKGTDCERVLIDALDTVCEGETYFSKGFLDVNSDRKRDPKAFEKILSNREIELMPLFASGSSNEEIAGVFGISPLTVQGHRKTAMAKIGVHSTPELMRWARVQGFRGTAV